MTDQPAPDPVSDAKRRIAAAMRNACVRAARQGYENAAASGLCDEGALEAAIGAIQMVDLAAVLEQAERTDD